MYGRETMRIKPRLQQIYCAKKFTQRYEWIKRRDIRWKEKFFVCIWDRGENIFSCIINIHTENAPKWNYAIINLEFCSCWILMMMIWYECELERNWKLNNSSHSRFFVLAFLHTQRVGAVLSAGQRDTIKINF